MPARWSARLPSERTRPFPVTSPPATGSAPLTQSTVRRTSTRMRDGPQRVLSRRGPDPPHVVLRPPYGSPSTVRWKSSGMSLRFHIWVDS